MRALLTFHTRVVHLQVRPQVVGAVQAAPDRRVGHRDAAGVPARAPAVSDGEAVDMAPDEAAIDEPAPAHLHTAVDSSLNEDHFVLGARRLEDLVLAHEANCAREQTRSRCFHTVVSRIARSNATIVRIVSVVFVCDV